LVTIRKAELRDVPELFTLISHYAGERVLLPRPLRELYEHVREFTVAEEDGKVIGCGALKFYTHELAEVRSLCVAPELKSNGVGRRLAERLFQEAEEHGLKALFTLTVVPEFFAKLGFRGVNRLQLPMKIWRDCLHCPKLFHCDEKAMIVELSRRTAHPIESAPETADIAL
jgi:amino-acid N-acetyltransferase